MHEEMIDKTIISDVCEANDGHDPQGPKHHDDDQPMRFTLSDTIHFSASTTKTMENFLQCAAVKLLQDKAWRRKLTDFSK